MSESLDAGLHAVSFVGHGIDFEFDSRGRDAMRRVVYGSQETS